MVWTLLERTATASGATKSCGDTDTVRVSIGSTVTTLLTNPELHNYLDTLTPEELAEAVAYIQSQLEQGVDSQTILDTVLPPESLAVTVNESRYHFYRQHSYDLIMESMSQTSNPKEALDPSIPNQPTFPINKNSTNTTVFNPTTRFAALRSISGDTQSNQYLSTDHQGTIQSQLDTITNAPTSYDHSVFGTNADATISGNTAPGLHGSTINSLFPSLSNYGRRTYDQTTHSFLSMDPITRGHGYQPFGNQPLIGQYIDPTANLGMNPYSLAMSNTLSYREWDGYMSEPINSNNLEYNEREYLYYKTGDISNYTQTRTEYVWNSYLHIPTWMDYATSGEKLINDQLESEIAFASICKTDTTPPYGCNSHHSQIAQNYDLSVSPNINGLADYIQRNTRTVWYQQAITTAYTDYDSYEQDMQQLNVLNSEFGGVLIRSGGVGYEVPIYENQAAEPGRCNGWALLKICSKSTILGADAKAGFSTEVVGIGADAVIAENEGDILIGNEWLGVNVGLGQQNGQVDSVLGYKDGSAGANFGGSVIGGDIHAGVNLFNLLNVQLTADAKIGFETGFTLGKDNQINGAFGGVTVSFDKPKGESYYDDTMEQKTLVDMVQELEPLPLYCPTDSVFYICPINDEEIKTT